MHQRRLSGATLDVFPKFVSSWIGAMQFKLRKPRNRSMCFSTMQ